MLFYEFNLTPQPEMIYVFLGEGKYSKNQKSQDPPPLNPLQLRRKPNTARCRISMSRILKSPNHQKFG